MQNGRFLGRVCKICAKYPRKMSIFEEWRVGKNCLWINEKSYPPKKKEKIGINTSCPRSYPHYTQFYVCTGIVRRFVKIKHAFCVILKKNPKCSINYFQRKQLEIKTIKNNK